MKFLRFALLGALGLVLTATPGRATFTFTWTGLGANNNINTPGNWLLGSAPTGSGGEDLVFLDSARNAPRFTSNFTLQDITLSSLNTGFFLDGVSTPTLTVTRDIKSTAGSGYFLVFSGVTLDLAAGSHNFDVQGGDIYVFGAFTGSGDIVKTGNRSLVVANADNVNTITGNISLNAGEIAVAGDGALGAIGSAGMITMNGGRLTVADYDPDRTVKLYNDIALGGGTAHFGRTSYSNIFYSVGGALTLDGNVTSTNSIVDVNSFNQVTFNGNITGTSLRFNGGGTAILAGVNSYTGGTTVSNGNVIFMSSVPASGALKSVGSGYLGSGVTLNMQTGFLDLFNKGGTTGIVGFDSPDVSDPVHFTEDIDLGGFHSNARLGTATAAYLDGDITPQGSDYQFGGRGTLLVTSNLTGSGDVEVTDGLMLYLSGSNDYTGETEPIEGGVIFTTASAVPASADLYPRSGGYIGQTEGTGLTAAAYLALFYSPYSTGVVGFDADVPITGRTVSEAIDLSAFDAGAFLGTATNVTFDGVITPYNGQYRFTGFRDGQLTISTVLTGSDSVVIGLDGNDIYSVAAPGQFFSPSVTLNGANTYSGGTTLQSGRLILGNANALGTGMLTIDYHWVENQPAGLSTTTPGFVIPNAIDFVSSYQFYLGGNNDFTLSGNLTSTGEGIEKIDANVITLSGDNSGFDGYINVRRGDIIFASDTAAGTGSLFLDDVDGFHGNALFTSNLPGMGSLSGRSVTTLNLGPGTLTINQVTDDVFSGTITGAGNLVKSGTGRLVLDGSNTYGGNTTVTAGILVAGNGSALHGIVTVDGGTLSVASGITLPNVVSFGASGGTLAGNGTFAQSITLGNSARLSPGDSVGLLSFGSGLTFAPGGTFAIEVQTAGGARGVGYDSINVTGGLLFTATLGTPWTLNLSSLDPGGAPGLVADFNSSTSYSWLIAQSDGLTGFDPANLSIVTTGFANGLAGGAFNVSMAGNDLFLNFTPVPEPSTYALLALGLGAVVFPVLRRRKRI